MTAAEVTLRGKLRRLPSFPDDLPHFDSGGTESDPASQFRAWLDDAIALGHPAPHAGVIATSHEDMPAARVLILKDVDARGWHVATSSTSPTGHELAANPRAALTFFWPMLGRQVRVSGPVGVTSAEESAEDFRARPLASRIATLVGRQSDPLRHTADYDAAKSAVCRALDAVPSAIAPDWTVYIVEAERVEFWQAAHDDRHIRLRYTREGRHWDRATLWP